MVEFITGKRKSGKTYNLINSMREHIDRGEPCYYLVPEQSTLENEYHLIKEMEIIGESKSQGLIDIQVISFTKLANIILKKSQVRNMKLLNDIGSQIILRKAIDDLNLTIFKNPKEKEFAELLKVVAQIREIKDIENKIKDISDLKMKNKLEEIVLIKNKYLSLIGEDYIDKKIYLDTLTDFIKKDLKITSSYFYVDDFNNLTAKQLDILKAISFSAKEVKIAFNLDLEDPKFFEPTYTLFNELKEYFLEEKIDFKVTNLKNQYYNSKELKALENKLTKFKTKSYEGKLEDIFLSRLTNIDDEVKNLFESIIKLIDEGSYSYKDIKVICNNIDEYRPYLKLYRKLYQVPLFIDEKINLHNHPIVRIILNILLLKEDYYTDAILDMLKTGYFSFTNEEIEKIEQYTFSYGINSYKWKRAFELNEEAEAIRFKIVALIDKLKKIVTGVKVEDKILNLYEALSHLEIYESLTERIDKFKEKENYNNIYYNTQTWNAILNVFDQMVNFMGDKRVSFMELYRFLKESLSLVNISLLPIKSQEVLVIDGASSLKEKAKVAFVLGFNEGFYPKTVGTDPIFPLEQEEYLAAKLKWSRSSKVLREIKNLEAYSSLTMATDKLYISYFEIDGKGEAVKPAYLLAELHRKFPGLELLDIDLENRGYFYSEDILFINLLKNMTEGKALATLEVKALNPKAQKLMARLTDLKNKEEGIIAENIIKEIIFKKDIPIFSISKLESYGRCPYQYYVKNILRPMEQREYRLENIDLGNIFHKLLEKSGNKGAFGEISEEKIGEIVDGSFKEVEEENNLKAYDTNYFIYQLNKIKEEGKNIVNTLIEALKTDGFKPRYYELEFGVDKSLPSFIVDIDQQQKIQIEGKIDRLDIYKKKDKNYLKVLDYKLSDKKIELREAVDGITFQLFIYLESIIKNKDKLSLGNLQLGGLFYASLIQDIKKDNQNLSKGMKGYLIKNEDEEFKYDNSKIKVDQIDREVYEAINKRIFNKIRKYIEGMLKGNFKVNPYYYKRDYNACKYCEYYRLCGNKDKFRICKYEKNKKIMERLEKNDQLDQGTAGNHR